MTRAILISCLLLTLPLAIACGESTATSGPVVSAPKPAPGGHAPVPDPGPPAPSPEPSTSSDQPGDECTADVDCMATALPEAAVTSESDCCFPTCQKRVASRRRVDELQASFGATCKAVLCAPQSCSNAADPVPVCRQGRCIAHQ